MSRETAIINANIVTDGRIARDCFVLCNGSVIVEAGAMSGFFHHGARIIDAEGLYLCAAYIDIHTHGASLYDAMDATGEAMDAICRFQFEHGTGTFLPTTLTAPLSSVQSLLDLLADYHPPVPVELPGIHMEGPFLSSINRGAQPEEYLLCPDDDNMSFMERNRKQVRLITISPDVPNITRLINFCRQNGIVVSGGHDGAIDDEVLSAMEAGMTGVTHIYCCSSTVSRRAGDCRKHLGLTELALLNDSLYAEAIADNCHLPPALLQLVYRTKGYRNVCLVSDSIRAAGMKPGNYMLGGSTDGVEVTVTPEVALLKERNLFAGSITPVSRMVANAVDAGIPLEHAVAMATETPARILGLQDRGSVKPGCSSRLNLLDANGRLRYVLTEDGKQVDTAKAGDPQ